MTKTTTHIRIDGEPFLGRAKAYREKRLACIVAWSDFAKGFGAISIPEGLHGLNFGSNTPPKGWLKPSGKEGYSRPKKGHPDLELFAALKAECSLPDPREVYGDAIRENLNYELLNGTKAYGAIGRMWGPHVGWAGDTFFGIVPDAEAAVADLLARHPDAQIMGDTASWRMPDGLTRISEAEYDLAFAQHRVAEERAAALASKAA